jgi:molybdopterin converting factor subunit 1
MKIRYFAWIKDITKIEIEEINDLSVNDTKKLISLICFKYPKLNLYFKENIIRIAVNLEYISSIKKLSPKDEIAFFPPVSGG